MRAAVCAAMGIGRLVELGWSRGNIERAGAATEGEWSRATYPLIVALHTSVIAGTFLFGRGRPRWPWLALLLAVQPIRVWVLARLGSRWNTRAAVPDEVEIETGGPYRLVRHPNYSVVAIEILALPLTFGVRWLAVIGTLTNAVLLAPRIREEEQALMRNTEYRRVMGRRKRFIPGVV